MSSMPGIAGTEQTTTVVIGTGLSGLAVAAELRRHGVDSIVVDGLDILGQAQPANTTSLQRCDAADSGTLRERNEILRHLRNYAASHSVDVRNTTRAVQLTMLEAPDQAAPQWQVHTPTGILVADHIVLTRCAHSQLRRMLNDFGIAVGRNVAAAMRAIGIYLVGVGELITPSPKEVLRQAKTVGQAISAKVNPDGALPSTGVFPATGSFAALGC
ncbi:2-polyprenyl-6-methoxyphenol hydroxylase-like FAD-dependent oxidoreductase [Pseudarthrobacter defluvii]|uniref:2-polyprenyl-6-methoxyphenol hydroxylase-like FAD-dependent oxidoreductase n=2 Tax=Micrococcales TaxID=85006 RepID=A0ABT9UBL6_9MICC|nr:2-polyprenyl-6-methoxyphenol hydroxylase-like FAD-dependent oxidoreductase [Pseudarthrobacter defluvii]VXC17018.1 FAD-binding protein [Arthrobacter sp. 8AJ]